MLEHRQIVWPQDSWTSAVMELLSIKWTDFQSNLTKSYAALRRQQDFYDVTLISEDAKKIEGHKLVLSACSSFFKKVFTDNRHSHPLLYLGGVNSVELELIVDYIYCGEVKVPQENLEKFLCAAEKLQLDGLSDLSSDDVNTAFNEKTKPGTNDIKEDFKVEKEEMEPINSIPDPGPKLDCETENDLATQKSSISDDPKTNNDLCIENKKDSLLSLLPAPANFRKHHLGWTLVGPDGYEYSKNRRDDQKSKAYYFCTSKKRYLANFFFFQTLMAMPGQ